MVSIEKYNNVAAGLLTLGPCDVFCKQALFSGLITISVYYKIGLPLFFLLPEKEKGTFKISWLDFKVW